MEAPIYPELHTPFAQIPLYPPTPDATSATTIDRTVQLHQLKNIQPIAPMSLWQSYRNLAPRTRLIIGGGIMAYAAFGLLASDQAEKLLGWTATEEDRRRLKEELPKVHVVDRNDK
jgi:hypothetical protein